MSKKIKKIIKNVRHRLAWPVTDVRGPGIETLYITTDHRARTHTIYVPDHDVRDIEYLHELGHATLSERVHPMLSTQVMAAGTRPDQLMQVQPAAQAASDWYCDEWLFCLLPEECRREVDEHVTRVVDRLSAEPSGTPELFTGAVLMLAQGERYCNRRYSLGGLLQRGVSALLAVDPARPGIGGLEQAVNGVLACYCNLRVRHIVESGLHCWRVEEVQ